MLTLRIKYCILIIEAGSIILNKLQEPIMAKKRERKKMNYKSMDHQEALDTWNTLSIKEQRSILVSEKMELEKTNEANSIIYEALDDEGVNEWHAKIRVKNKAWGQWQRDEPAKFALCISLQRSKLKAGGDWREEIEEVKEAKRLVNAEKRKQKKIAKRIAQLQAQLK